MPTNTNTEVIDTTTPPQGLFLFEAGGAIEFLTLDSGPSLFEQPAAAPWFPLPGEPVGCLVWFNTTTGEKGRVTFPLRLTTPGECVWDVATASAGDGVGLSLGVRGGVYDGGIGFRGGRRRQVGRFGCACTPAFGRAEPTLATVRLSRRWGTRVRGWARCGRPAVTGVPACRLIRLATRLDDWYVRRMHDQLSTYCRRHHSLHDAASVHSDALTSNS